jgi:exopolyphosphatase/pppGpp-phosphohydrolase
VFRSARNAKDFLDRVREEVDLHFRIIDPGEEVSLTAIGCKNSLPNQTFFIVDMGGGSTEIGLFTKKEGELLDWISIPCGLFFFHTRQDHSLIPIDIHKALLAFNARTKPLGQKIPIVICRSLIMNLLCNYIAKYEYLDKKFIYGNPFQKDVIISIVRDILKMDKQEIRKLNKNIQYISSIKPILEFINRVMGMLSSDTIIFSNNSVKEGLVDVVGRYYYSSAKE